MIQDQNLDIMEKEFLDLCSDLEKCLLSIEGKKLKKSDNEEISRILHSIKGLFGFLGDNFSALVKVVHQFEDVFLEEIKLKKLSEHLIQELMEFIDNVKNLTKILGNNPTKKDIESLFPQIVASKANSPIKFEKRLKLVLYIEDSLKMKSSKMISILNILKMHSTINDSNPSLDMLLDNFEAFTTIEIFLTTRKSVGEIKEIILKFKDIKKYEIIEDEITNNGTAIEETSLTRISRTDYSIKSSEMVKITGILEEFIRIEKVVQQLEAVNLKRHEDQLLKSFKRKILEIQESINISRTLPLKVIFNPLPRLVRDLSKQYNKDVQFYTSGEDIELDRNILEKLTDPLVILLNNAFAHGIEDPKERKKIGKSPNGIIRIEIAQNSGITAIKVFDNGRGIDFKKIWSKAKKKSMVEGEYTEIKAKQALFAPGFSTLDDATTTAGRGMGLSQVKKFVMDMNGNLNVSTNLGENTTFEMIFPVQNSIASTILVEINNYNFGFPETHIRKIFKLNHGELSPQVINEFVFPLDFQENQLKIINLPKIIGNYTNPIGEGSILLWNNGIDELGFLVNEVITFEEMAINYSDQVANITPIFAGTASFGSGDIVFLLHPQSFIETYDL